MSKPFDRFAGPAIDSLMVDEMRKEMNRYEERVMRDVLLGDNAKRLVDAAVNEATNHATKELMDKAAQVWLAPQTASMSDGDIATIKDIVRKGRIQTTPEMMRDAIERLGRNAAREAERYAESAREAAEEVMKLEEMLANAKQELRQKEEEHSALIVMAGTGLATLMGVKRHETPKDVKELGTALVKRTEWASARLKDYEARMHVQDTEQFAAKLRLKMREQFPDLQNELVAFAAWRHERSGRRASASEEDAKKEVEAYFEHKEGHTHACPECFEDVHCVLDCAVETDGDGKKCGLNQTCDACKDFDGKIHMQKDRKADLGGVLTWCGGFISDTDASLRRARVLNNAIHVHDAEKSGKLCPKCKGAYEAWEPNKKGVSP